MHLRDGTRIGPYEILAAIGAGGMGEVYRARDARLKRDVAIKVLSASFAADLDRRERLEREAQVLAALSHPHIGAIYGIEESDPGSVLALILELIEGDTLAERLARGPLTIDEALSIATQIASALEAAHDKGIVHRDLKPANIKITHDGIVKVLDFGLAKGGAADTRSSSESPTMQVMTRDGELVGTVAYMSPEQARGRTVDKRTDVWAFGCVLFEMLTGRAIFASGSVADTIAAILHVDPPWNALPAALSPHVRRLLRRCLEKDLRRRQRDLGDARLDLDEAIAGASDPAHEPAAIAARPDIQVQRLTDEVGLKEAPAISPDGKMVAFVSLVKGRKQIWIRLLAGGAPLQVTRDAIDHETPRWSPDSSAILYYTPSATLGEDGTLWEVSAFGGPARRVARSLGGGDISHDGRRVALFRSLEGHAELAILARDGSHTAAATPLPREHLFSAPRWSPDDRAIAFQRASASAFDMCVCTMSAAGGEVREIVSGFWLRGLCWLPDGSGLVYSSSRGSTILYPPTFNLRRVSIEGTHDRQITFGEVAYVEPDAHLSGRVVSMRLRSDSDIWRFPTTGTPSKNTRGATRVTRQTGQVQVPSASPDGKRIVYLSDNGGHSNLWVVNTDGSDARQITFETDPAVSIGVPIWSPSGGDIVFVVARTGHVDLWTVNPDGSHLRRAVEGGWAAAWSTDGEWLYYTPTRPTAEIEKRHLARGTIVRVRGGASVAAVPAGLALYYVRPLTDAGTWGDSEIHRAEPEDNDSTTLLARIPGWRVPLQPRMIAPIPSPDGRWLAMPLMDGTTSNLWVLSTGDGEMRAVTDFGDRSVSIVRRVSWSPDSASIYAAVAEIDGDVVLLDGLLG